MASVKNQQIFTTSANVIEPFPFQFLSSSSAISDHYYLLFQGEVTIARVSDETQKINNKFSHLIAAFEMYLINVERCIKIEPSS
jgi:hypothetical protein